MISMTDDTEPLSPEAPAPSVLRGVVQTYAASLLPYAIAVSILLILATIVPPISYFIFLLWFAFLIFLGLVVVAPFFSRPLRDVPVGSTFSTRTSFWAALGTYLTGMVVTIVGMWVVSLFYETGGGIIDAARIIGLHGIILIPGALVVWGLLSLLETLLHRQLSRRK